MNTQEKVLWQASKTEIQNSHLFAYMQWLSQSKGLNFSSYEQLWAWSADQHSQFWQSIWEYFDILHDGTYDAVCSNDVMPYTQWFKGTKLNFAEHLFRHVADSDVALKFTNENDETRHITWKELKEEVAAFQSFLIRCGVVKGDRVVAYLPNISEAFVACIASCSLGAIWSSCSPDFGVSSVIDRFSQIDPKIFIGVDGYRYGGKTYQRAKESKEICASLPNLTAKVMISYIHAQSKEDNFTSWNLATTDQQNPGKIHFERVPFDHPLWVLFSSGTTGIPKAITHCHGGILLELLKYSTLQNDCHPGENFFWYTTTGWMMWNFLFGALLAKGTVVLYDGSPGYPDLDALWKIAEREKIHHFGTSAPFLIACMKNDFSAKGMNLEHLRTIGSTGAPLPAEAFEYVYQHIKKDLWLCSMSGGTDVCTAFIGSSIWKPVTSGKSQARALGCALYAYDEGGNKVYEALGEMVIEKPMPSMPVFFWNDEGHKKYLESYFEMYENIWRHGDWISIDKEGQILIYGRSDATLNRQGIRIGTSEIYNAVNKIEEVEDSLIVNIELEDGSHFMPLFVKIREGKVLSDDVRNAIKSQLRTDYSPRHVPDQIIQIADIPYTISGKKLETPVKKILMGRNPNLVANKESLRNPNALEYFVQNKEKILSLKF